MTTSSENLVDSRALPCSAEGFCGFALRAGLICSSPTFREAALRAADAIVSLMGADRVEVHLDTKEGATLLASAGVDLAPAPDELVRVPFDGSGRAAGHLIAWGCGLPGAAKGLEAVAALLGGVLGSIDERDRLRGQVESRDRYFAAFSHEIRTPLTSIRSLSEVLTAETDPEVAAEYVAIVHDEAVRLSRLVNRNLDMDKLRSGAELLYPANWDPAEILGAAARSVRPLCSEKGVAVEVEVPEGLPQFRLDRDLIVQVLVNLLTNAVRFSPAGGLVSLCAELLPEGLRVLVRDRGPGVPVADREAIFERYRQVRGGECRGGTGLGLAIAREIVKAHGGRISVREAPGGGAEFAFLLPTPKV